MKKIAVDAARALEYKELTMKKFVLAIVIAMSMIGSAVANDRHHRPHHRPHVQHHHHGHHGHHRWVAPLIIGGAIGYGVTRYYSPPPVYYPDQPVVMHRPPVVVAPQCTRYIYQDSYGNTIREETRCE